MWPTPAVDRLVELGSRLGVAVQVDPRRVEASRSASASSPPEATSQASPSSASSRYTAVQGNALEANSTSTSRWRAATLDERARSLADVLLDDDVGRRAELARQLDRVAAAELQVAARVDAGPGG